MIRRWGPGIVGVFGVASLIALSGCASAGDAPVAQPPGTSSPSATAATASGTVPLTCDAIVDPALVDQALQSASAPANFQHLWLVKRGYDEVRSYAVEAAGGLSCAWTASPDSADAPWLQVSVLPDSPASVSPYLFGDAPTDQTRRFGTRTVTAACGDPGCGAMAVVNGRWVDIRLNIPGLGTTGTPLGSIDTIFDQASPALAAIFDTLASATPAQVAWPTTSTLNAVEQEGRMTGDALCVASLRASDLGVALGDPTVSWQLATTPPALRGISDLALDRMGAVQCQASGPHYVQMTIAPGNAWIAGDIGTNPRARRVFEKTRLIGQVEPEATFSDCAPGDPSDCTAILSLGTGAVSVTGSGGSRAIAEAITSYAR